MIIITSKNYAHINRSLPNWDTPYGKLIKSKSHYEDECKKAGMVSYESASQKNKYEQEKKNKFSVSSNSIEIMKSIKSSADKKGNVKLSDRQIDAMKKNGMKFGEKMRSQISGNSIKKGDIK